MVKISDIIGQVEYQKEGWSDAHSVSEWKSIYKKRKEIAPETQSPTRKELNALQEKGTLSRNMPEINEIKIVGK